MNAQQRKFALVIAVLTALVLVGASMMLSANKDRATNQASDSQSVEQQAGGESSSDSNDAAASDTPRKGADGKPFSYDRQPTTGRPACPEPAGSEGHSGATVSADAKLKDLELPCLGHDSTPGSLIAHVAGKPTLLNVWAYWCVPCRQELPVLDEAAQKHPEWNIVGVHASPQGAAGVNIMLDLGLKNLASFQDADNSVATTLGMSPLIPQSVVLNSDGTVAEIFPGIVSDTAQLEELMAKAH